MEVGSRLFQSGAFDEAQEQFQTAVMIASNDSPFLQSIINAKRFAVYSEAESCLEINEYEAARDAVESLHSDLARITATETRL
jgi:hypothetical protein